MFASPPRYVEGLPTPDRALVMGVVNVTPDSFSDGGMWLEPDEAVKHGLAQAAAGADLVGVARAAGIESACWAGSVAEFAAAAERALTGTAVSFIGVKVTTERAAVPPYPIDEVENKYRLIRYVEKTERIEILKTGLPASYD